MRKLSTIILAVALVLGLTQCKKEQSATPQSEGVMITLNVGDNNNGSRANVDPNGTTQVTFESGDEIYVAYNGEYVGSLSRNGSYFEGFVNITPVTPSQPLYFYYLGDNHNLDAADSEGKIRGCTATISDQHIYPHLPVISMGKSTVNYSENITSYSSRLYNKCSLMKFNVTTPSTADICITGMNNKVIVNFGDPKGTTNGFTYDQVDGGLIQMAGSSTAERWVIVLPQTELGEGEGGSVYSTDGIYSGRRPPIHAIESNKWYHEGEDIISMTLNQYSSNVVDLATLTRNYEAQNGQILINALSGNYKITIADDATITLRNATIKYTTINTNWAGLSCLGDATIMLEGTNIVESGMYRMSNRNIADYPGIHIATSHTLTIDGSGELTASSCRQTNFSRGAGIGGGYNEACGDIVIKGGIIHALGGKLEAAGIGSAGNYNNNAACGNITIEGGEVEAIAYGVAAGIGCGLMNHCGNILIKNGAVTAQGGEGSAGIGAAYSANNSSGASNSQCGTITIEGGTVTATGGQFGAGIGSGTSRGDYSHSICGTITIEGGTVTATGGEGGMVDNNVFYGAAGIGTGSSILGGYNGYSDCGDITITSGVTSVTATKGGGTYPAENSIGKNHSNGSGTCGTVTIENGANVIQN